MSGLSRPGLTASCFIRRVAGGVLDSGEGAWWPEQG